MKFGLTQGFACSYLPHEQERLLVLVDDANYTPGHYEMLLSAGFRRSGEQIYRPHCASCNACQSLRIPAAQFTPSRSQRRVLKRNADVEVRISREDKTDYYQLYERYINQRHADGTMYPATPDQYRSFIGSSWMAPFFMEFHAGGELIAVAVTDELQNALSALYTFFKPDADERSLGTFAILQQLALASSWNKEFVYLGYQVDACTKMNYKSRFSPHQRFIDNQWQSNLKKAD